MGLTPENRFWQAVGSGSPGLGSEGAEDPMVGTTLPWLQPKTACTPSGGQEGDESLGAPRSSHGGQMGQPRPHGGSFFVLFCFVLFFYLRKRRERESKCEQRRRGRGRSRFRLEQGARCGAPSQDPEIRPELKADAQLTEPPRHPPSLGPSPTLVGNREASTCWGESGQDQTTWVPFSAQ